MIEIKKKQNPIQLKNKVFFFSRNRIEEERGGDILDGGRIELELGFCIRHEVDINYKEKGP